MDEQRKEFLKRLECKNVRETSNTNLTGNKENLEKMQDKRKNTGIPKKIKMALAMAMMAGTLTCTGCAKTPEKSAEPIKIEWNQDTVEKANISIVTATKFLEMQTQLKKENLSEEEIENLAIEASALADNVIADKVMSQEKNVKQSDIKTYVTETRKDDGSNEAMIKIKDKKVMASQISKKLEKVIRTKIVFENVPEKIKLADIESYIEDINELARENNLEKSLDDKER